MDISNIDKEKEWCVVLQTGERSQTAMMTLKPGDATAKRLRRMNKAIRSC